MDLFEAVRVAGDAVEALKNAELNQHLANVKMEAVKLLEENVRLREDLIALRESAKLRDALLFRDNVYWRVTADGEDGPFCHKCWDGSQKLVRLADSGQNQWRCAVCSETPWKPGGRERFNAARNATRVQSRVRTRQW